MNFKCWKRFIVLAAMVAAVATSGGAVTAQGTRPRVVSINLCTDQLVLALADPVQIAGLGRFSRHAEMSYLSAKAAAYPSLRGSAEEVLRLQPELVLAGAYSGRATREFLSARGLAVEIFAPPRSIAEAKAEIERMGSLLGQPVRAASLVAEIGAALAEASTSARGHPTLSALAIQRRGFASGRDTLLSAAIGASGYTNAADALGITGIGRAPLETIAKLQPDVLILEDLAVSRDQSTALLHHPVLARARGTTRIIKLPVAEVTCGGPSLAPLIRRIASERGGYGDPQQQLNR